MVDQELELLYRDYHSDAMLALDPLEFVHRYKDPRDQEVVAVLGALLAYGNVTQIRGSIQKVIDAIAELGQSPGDFPDFLLSTAQGIKKAKIIAKFSPLYHRFNRGEDFLVLFELMAKSRREYGSVGEHFHRYWKADDPTIESSIEGLVKSWIENLGTSGFPVRDSVRFLLTRPSDGSTCKRWCMLVRWMGRYDKIDVGLWAKAGDLFLKNRKQFLRPNQLIIPLDTHTGRMSFALGLTKKKTLGWKAALEVTEALRRVCPEDPLKYDFALCHAGIMKRILKAHGKSSDSKPLA